MTMLNLWTSQTVLWEATSPVKIRWPVRTSPVQWRQEVQVMFLIFVGM